MATLDYYNCGVTKGALLRAFIGTGRVATSLPTFPVPTGNLMQIASSPDTLRFWTGTAQSSPTISSSNDITFDLESWAGFKATLTGAGGYWATVAEDSGVQLVWVAAVAGLPNVSGNFYILVSEGAGASGGVDYKVMPVLTFYSNSLGFYVTQAGFGTTAGKISIGTIELDPATIVDIAARIAAMITINNNINVQPAEPAGIDTAGVISAITLVKNAIDSKVIPLSEPDFEDIVGAIGEVSTTISGMGDTAPDLRPQLNEMNRQLSLIHSRLFVPAHNEDPEQSIAERTGGGGSGGKILGPDGQVVDLGDYFDQIVEAIASGGLLCAEKMEPIRGFFQMLKEKNQQ